MKDRWKGYLLGVVAAASYGTNPLFALPLYEKGMTPDAVLFMRYLVALPVLASLILLRGKSFRVNRAQCGSLVVLGILVALSSLTLFMSYNYMDVGIASTILFVYPIMVAVIMATLFHEKANALTVVCILLATAGIALLMKGGGDDTALSLTGFMLVMASALSYAIYIVAVNRTSLVRVPTLTVTFYVLLFGVSLFISSLLLSDSSRFAPRDDPAVWGCIIGLAVFPTAISFACTNGAIQSIGSTPTAILGAFEPVTAVIIGVCIFDETLTPRISLGLLLIIVAVVLVIVGPGIARPLTHVRRMFPHTLRRLGRRD